MTSGDIQIPMAKRFLLRNGIEERAREGFVFGHSPVPGRDPRR